MRLQPTRPPGRATRKALEFQQEIQRLRAMGYSFEAIRGMLAGVGVHVSKGTVRREAARSPATSAATPFSRHDEQAHPPTSAHLTPLDDDPLPPNAVEPPPARSSRQVAEDYFRDHISNPLMRNKEP